MKSALEKHREALVLRAQRLQDEREERRRARSERELAELRATGMIVPRYDGQVAEALEKLGEDKGRNWLRFWSVGTTNGANPEKEKGAYQQTGHHALLLIPRPR